MPRDSHAGRVDLGSRSKHFDRGSSVGSARNGEELLLWQTHTILPTLPAPVRFLLRVLPFDPVARVSRNHARLKGTTEDVVRMDGQRINAKWFREFLAYNPADDLPKIEAPVLAITGAKDLQVSPDELTMVESSAGGPVATHLVPDVTHSLRRQELGALVVEVQARGARTGGRRGAPACDGLGKAAPGVRAS